MVLDPTVSVSSVVKDSLEGETLSKRLSAEMRRFSGPDRFNHHPSIKKKKEKMLRIVPFSFDQECFWTYVKAG